MANVTVSTGANFIPELWSSAILDYAERAFSLRNQVSDFSGMIAGGGDTIHIPKVTEETAAAKSAGTAVTYSANTDGKVDLAIDQHHYEAKRIDDIVMVQESADLFNMYTRSMGYAIAKKVENYLAVSVIQAATGNDTALSTDNQLTASLLRSGLVKLLDAGHDYTDGNTWLYASPEVYSYLLGLDEFVHFDKRGDVAGQVKGKVGDVYGMPVIVSNDWDDDGGTGDETASIFKRESIYFAMQMQPRVQSSYDIDYLATSVVADVLFGSTLSHAASSTSCGVVNFTNP
tara:strand:- start:1832 stop:2695 length:864 start_codon:yes stop_codon:yes gene_type:complete